MLEHRKANEFLNEMGYLGNQSCNKGTQDDDSVANMLNLDVQEERLWSQGHLRDKVEDVDRPGHVTEQTAMLTQRDKRKRQRTGRQWEKVENSH